MPIVNIVVPKSGLNGFAGDGFSPKYSKTLSLLYQCFSSLYNNANANANEGQAVT